MFYKRQFIRKFSAVNYKDVLKKINDCVLIDVRTEAEASQGMIPSAINIPLHNLELTLVENKLSRDKEIIFYCKSGIRSAKASKIAENFGFKNVSNYEGSYSDWVSHQSRCWNCSLILDCGGSC